MKWITKLCLTCISLFAPFLTNGQQSEAEIFRYADSLYAAQRFFQASIEYERIVFEHADPIYSAKAKLKKAYCLKPLGEFSKAQRSLEELNMMVLDDTLSYLVHYEISLLSFLDQRYTESVAQFKKMDFFLQDSSLTINSYYLRVLALTQSNQYEEAESALRTLINFHDLPKTQKDSLLSETDLLFSKKAVPKIKKEETARFLATIFPGMGHVYAGRPLEGLFNFSIHVAFLAYCVVNFINANYFTTFTFGTGLLQAFYFGGQKRAEYLVRKRNYKKTSKHYAQVLELIKVISANGSLEAPVLD